MKEGCSYANLLIPEMLLKTENTLTEIKPFEAEFFVKFDKTDGFVSDYHHNFGYMHGLLSEHVSECCTWYEVTSFKPLTTTL